MREFLLNKSKMQKKTSGQLPVDQKAMNPEINLNFYCGTAPSGRHKLRICNKNWFGHGVAIKRDKDGNWKPLEDSEFYKIGLSIEGIAKISTLDCVDRKHGFPVRFLGRLEENNTAPSSFSELEVVKSQPPTKKRKQTLGSEPKYTKELARVRAIQKEGLDPTVRMAFIKIYLGISSATVYREMSRRNFPMPIKNGRSSSWLLSQVDAYRLGSI
jgi:predicted DNA-binding transcriptional regulator AlpA